MQTGKAVEKSRLKKHCQHLSCLTGWYRGFKTLAFGLARVLKHKTILSVVSDSELCKLALRLQGWHHALAYSTGAQPRHR